ncbi:hypothetical protein FQN57_003437 [Myotisia sp. PD_48]|nr:hypothetical protein FQN57_003437 [Myotisia sp. PD_48]
MRIKPVLVASLISCLPGTFSFLLSDPLRACPIACDDAKQPELWTSYHSLNRLTYCPLPILFETSIYVPLDSPNHDVTLRACYVGDLGSNSTQLAEIPPEVALNPVVFHAEKPPVTCPTSKDKATAESQRILAWGAGGDTSGVSSAVESVLDYVKDNHHCSGATAIFAYAQGTVVGAFVGEKLTAESAAAGLKAQGPDLLQVCGDGRNSEHVAGIAVDTNANFARVQKAIKSWSDAECVTADGKDTKTVPVSLSAFPESTGVGKRNVRGFSSRFVELARRADCKAIRVASGDSCGTLAGRCGVSGSDLEKYNKKTEDFCSTLQPGQWVCCSEGTLPDMTPKPQPDGICANYVVQKDDYCAKIAASNSLTMEKLEEFNKKKTWGWNGCDNLQLGVRICLSTGDAPLPAPISNAVCGPTMPGTVHPGEGKNISLANPCPLNVCCNIWGQCGMDAAFCTVYPSKTGNPGTSPIGKSACISNCGTDIVNNDKPPASWRNVAYFEAWNYNRVCLHMDVDKIPEHYGTIHFSFAWISPSFEVVIPEDTKKQFDIFTSMKTDQNKVLAFGGWDFSTLPATYQLFRDAVKAENRDKFATNCVNFLKEHNLDGLDFDWEYPGAPDIPDIPAGAKDEGLNYYKFLRVVKSKLPAGKSLSIAAPASYWYLKQFPIKEMSSTLDYIVFMTYDLHGQWDYGNKWASPGCPEGNCLRSHVNRTETNLALSMVTKAGVQSNKLLVGITSYGRSFKMVDPECHGPECHFVGKLSAAQKGICTDTAGYISNPEILSVVENGQATWTEHWLKNFETDMTDYVVYDEGEWVAYMSRTNAIIRSNLYSDLNFGGTSLWAVDLESWDGPSENKTEFKWECPGKFDTLEAIEKEKDSIQPHCKNLYMIRVLRKILESGLKTYDDLMKKDYDRKYELYSEQIQQMAPATLVQFLKKRSNEWFNCDVEEEILCCDKCNKHWTEKQCQHCDKSCSGDDLRTAKIREKCPSDVSMVGMLPYQQPGETSYNVYWSLQSGADKEKAFRAAALADSGIALDWIGMSKDKQSPAGVPCAGTWECECGNEPPATCKDHTGYWYDAPYISQTNDDGVSDPKEFIEDGLKKLKSLAPELEKIEAEIELFAFIGHADELVEAVSLPILMVDEAIELMKKVYEIGEEIEEAKRKEFIMWFITAILFILPLAGQALAAVGRLAAIGRGLAMLGEAGGVAFEVWSVVDDPSSAPMVVFGLVFGALGVRDAAKIGQASKAMRSMSSGDIAKLGGKIPGRLNTIRNIIGRSAVCGK